VEIVISNTNITQVPADLLVLKHADKFHGADKTVARIVGFDDFVPIGKSRFVSGAGVAASEVLFIGVGPLIDFRYERIQGFGAQAIKLARKHHNLIRHLALTIHGPGYGLDPEQSFLSMIAGIVSEWRCVEGSLRTVTVAELSDKRCEQLNRLLQQRLDEFRLTKSQRRDTVMVPDSGNSPAGPSTAESNINQFGARAEVRPRLSAAMPFADEFIDEFEIGFHEAAKSSDYICERLDLESFTGDIVAEIKKRILGSHGIIALLNNHNPNVFLEIGFAWAHSKPIILVAKDGVKLPFDISGHRCIRYRSISQLRQTLTAEIASLKARGVLAIST
jgi:hypothetical protein